jgi:uncharacterized protein YceK
MASKGSAAILVAGVVLGLAGCGTILNLKDPPGSQVPRKRIYGGVQLDVANGTQAFEEVCTAEGHQKYQTAVPRGVTLALGAYLLAIDVPLSAIGDTLTLPITVCATLAGKDEPANSPTP